MAAEPPNSSWHPALMPNAAELQIPDASPSPTPSLPANDREQPSIEESKPKNDILANEPHHDEIDADAWLSNGEQDGDDGADAWISSPKAAPSDPVEGTDHTEINDAKAAPVEDVENAKKVDGIEKVAASRTTAQHASSKSFARTVSHEISFGEDDDGEWTLDRADTDPFKFMPPSDRTNSFPVPPPIATDSKDGEDVPLPSNQALDVMEETERNEDEEAAAWEQPLDEHGATGPTTTNDASYNGPGSNLTSFDGAEPGSRFEEGVPLLNHGTQEGGVVAQNPGKSADPFADDDNDQEDDFFSQIQDSKSIEPEAPPLERKSTMQVLASTSPEPMSRLSTFEEPIDEESWTLGEGAPDETQFAETGALTGSPALVAEPKDLSAKWEEAFAGDDDDEDFLLDDNTTEAPEIDAAAFLGSDDEGLLGDDDEDLPIASASQSNQALPETSAQRSGANRYAPPTTQQTSTAPFQGAPVLPSTGSTYNSNPAPPPFNATPPASVGQDLSRAQSFADKSKGGYSSPYDLPTDLVSTPAFKPRKRTSMQQLPQSSQPPSQPPLTSRSASMMGPPSTSPPTSSHGPRASTVSHKASAPTLRNKSSFFEELPIAPKPRPSSRHSNTAASQIRQPPPQESQGTSPPMANMMPPPPPANLPKPEQQPSLSGNLVAPERVNPYAALQSSAPAIPPPSSASTRYSPAPMQTGPGQPGSVPPAATSRYSPAPPSSRPSSARSPPGTSPVPPPTLPHQPRTSSPLAHFEINNEKAQRMAAAGTGEGLHHDRRAVSSHEPRLNRVTSLPPTQEAEEEEDVMEPPRSVSATYGSTPPKATSKYSPVPSSATHQQPPPLPTSHTSQSLPSVAPRSSSYYAPQPSSATATAVEPPLRAQTQSPGAAHGPQAVRSDQALRPSSAHSAASPVLARTTSGYSATGRTRGKSMTMHMIPPTDGREQDPLQRWKGVPIMTWGVGGTIVTSFPNSIPRYGMNQSQPSLVRAPGEIKVRSIKDIEPLQERLAKFPGPLKGKSKKKETLAWLSSGIETLEKDLPEVSLHSQLSLAAKRSLERLLLWKILRIFIEFDGALEGSAAVEKAVRDVLSSGATTPTSDNDAMFPDNSSVGLKPTSVTPMASDGADTAAMEQMRNDLMNGDREAAVWSAVDKRLWGHAMLISHTMSPELYGRVAQEFVRKEVNYPGHNNEPLAALYKVLSGNYDDCVDELVPAHARAGFQLMSTGSSGGVSRDAAEGLDKWRETLTLVLSNRSVNDVRGLHALGNLLAGYGRAEAAHICYLFSRNISVFGGIDDPNSDFVLVGSDHRQQSDQFAKETEALQLSEVYEYGLSLAGGAAATAGAPHLAAYKLQHAMTLAEYGSREKALQYCEAIMTAMTSQTKRSPYHHQILLQAVDNFTIRLKQAPKVEAGSWKTPSMGKVSDSMWNRFNKFVSGDEGESNGLGGAGDGENGPFARISTPTLSRSPSHSNFDTFGRVSPGYHAVASPVGPPTAPAAAAGRYAPMGSQPAAAPIPNPASNSYEAVSSYAPLPTNTESSGPHQPPQNSSEQPYPGANPVGAVNGNYGAAPSTMNYQPSQGYQPSPSYQPSQGYEPSPPLAANGSNPYEPSGAVNSLGIRPAETEGNVSGPQPLGQGYEPPMFGYDAPQMAPSGDSSLNDDAPANNQSGYEPPSYQPQGYEPPSYDPGTIEEEGDDDAPKPKKKSFMDDDDDDITALKPQGKSRADVDRENEEMFRKAAEEDAKRAATQQSAKKGWGFGGWFGGGAKKADAAMPSEQGSKAIRAKLGESSSFVYDPDLKRWVNKKAGAENTEAKTATPPPPKGPPRSVSGTPPPMSSTPPMGGSAPPPAGPPRSIPSSAPGLNHAPSVESLGASAMSRSVSNHSLPGGPPSGPPSRPTTSMSNASSIDDLLGAAAPRKPGQKKARKSGRYVDVMAK